MPTYFGQKLQVAFILNQSLIVKINATKPIQASTAPRQGETVDETTEI